MQIPEKIEIITKFGNHWIFTVCPQFTGEFNKIDEKWALTRP